MTENEYKSILRGRMMDDDFIEDDDGTGAYVDDGRNEWERSGGEESDEESETEEDYYERTGRRKPKRKGKKASGSKSSKSESLVNAFARAPAAPRSGGISASSSARKAAEERSRAAMEAYRPKVNTEKEEDFMARLMGGLGADTSSASASASAASPAPTPARGYPGRPSNYNVLSGSPASVSRKRPYSSTIGLGSAGPSVTYRSSKRQVPSSPSAEGSAPSSDLPEPSSDGPDAPVHISGSDDVDWGLHGADDSSELSPADVTATTIGGRSGVVGKIGSLGLDSKRKQQTQGDGTRPRALRMQTGGPSDDDDGSDGDDEVAVQSISRGAAAAAAKQRRMNVSAEATAVPQVATVKEEPVDEAAAPAQQQPSRTAWQAINDSLKTVDNATTSAPASTSSSTVNALNDDGSLPFYWMDHLELEAGIILLIGKVKDRTTGKYVSACVRVEGVERSVFLLKRDRKIDDEGNVTDIEPTEDDIYDEFDEVRGKLGIKNFLGKTVTRSYAFELPGVPASGTYLKVKYGFDEPALPSDLQGKTFSHAFGTQTNAMELFLIKRKIMGPCWLKIESADALSTDKPLTWCKAEFSVDDAKFVSPATQDANEAGGGASDPPLTITSLSMRTVHNHAANKREIVAVSLRTWSDAQLEDVRNPEDRPSSLWTAVRPLAGQWPVGFEAEVRKQGGRVKAIKWERALLNGLLAQFQLLDPDIVLTHDFSANDLDVLLSRMKELRVDHWSRLGRFRRPGWPKLRNGWNLGMMKGRLCCDLSSDVGKSMISECARGGVNRFVC